MKRFFNALTVLLICCCASQIQAASISVDANRNGGFGAPLSNSGTFVDLIASDLLDSGTTYEISATGQIVIGDTFMSPPNGITLERSLLLGNQPEAFTPLEEGIIDGGGSVPISDGQSSVAAVGALIGIFVSDTLENSVGFDASDADSGGSLLSADLFLVGSSTTFTPTVAGKLYFGVNEAFVSNNSGSFLVSINAVPEPTSAILACFSIVLVSSCRKGKRTNTLASVGK